MSSYTNFKENEQKNVFGDQQDTHNPFLFVNNIIREKIQEERSEHFSIALGYHTLVAAITQPLNVIGTLMQLSVKEHKHIHDSPPVNTILNPQEFAKDRLKLDTKAVTRINKDITMTEKKKIQLQILSGTKHKPFTAPVYEGYLAVIRDLYNQGFKSFFKGSICSNTLQVYRASLRYGMMTPHIYKHTGEVGVVKSALLSYSVLTVMDILLNYIHTIQSRFILQSSLLEFSTYKSIKQFMFNNLAFRKNMYKGSSAHFLRNIFVVAGSVSAFGWQAYLASFLLGYPITTAYKRILCQSEEPGMIPTRYSSVWHALSLTLQEEGMRGLYKGVIANGAREALLYATFTWTYNIAVTQENEYWMRSYLSSQKY